MEPKSLGGLIRVIRDRQGILSHDLANLYDVAPKVLMQAVKRHRNRFPPDFMFKLSGQELANWKSQIVTSRLQQPES